MFRPERAELREYLLATFFTLVGLGSVWWETVAGTQNICTAINAETTSVCAAAMNSIPAKMLGVVASLYVLHAVVTALGRSVLGYEFATAKNRASATVFLVAFMGFVWVLLFTDAFVNWFFGG